MSTASEKMQQVKEWLHNLRMRESMAQDMLLQYNKDAYARYQSLRRSVEQALQAGEYAKAQTGCDRLTDMLTTIIRTAEHTQHQGSKQARMTELVKKLKATEPKNIDDIAMYNRAGFKRYKELVGKINALIKQHRMDEAENEYNKIAGTLKEAVSKAKRVRKKYRELKNDLDELTDDLTDHPFREEAENEYEYCMELIERTRDALRDVDNAETEHQLTDAHIAFANFVTAARLRIKKRKTRIITGIVGGVLAVIIGIVFFMTKH